MKLTLHIHPACVLVDLKYKDLLRVQQAVPPIAGNCNADLAPPTVSIPALIGRLDRQHVEVCSPYHC